MDLSENQIRQIENLPAGLQSLSLRDNQISQIENLPAGLQRLELWNNQISQIENIPEDLQELKLWKNPTKNIPPELLGDIWEDCLEAVNAWFADLARGKVVNQTVRVMVTGNGNVGKSSLRDALRDGCCTQDHDSTHAIRIETLELPGSPSVTAQVFDFGGQEIYSGTHRLFLRGRAVQLVVFDAQTESQTETPDRVNPTETVRNQPLRHWLHSIKGQSPESQFVLVQNKIDAPDLLDEATQSLLTECEQVEISWARVSARTGRGIASLRGHLLEAAQALPEYGMEMPLSWHRVRQIFIRNLDRVSRRKRLVEVTTFRRLCQWCGVLPNSENALLRYLHASGTVYYDENYLPDTLVANQEWAIRAIYTALDRGSEFYSLLLNLSYGKCQARQLFRAFGPDYTLGQRWLFLKLMQSCGLCFPLKESDRDEENEDTYYLFPNFLPAEMPSSVSIFIHKPGIRCFEQTSGFLPYAHVQALMARWGLKTPIANMGRTSVYVETPQGNLALVADLTTQTLRLYVEPRLPQDERNRLLWEVGYGLDEWKELTQPIIPEPVAVRAEPGGKSDIVTQKPDVVQARIRRLVVSYAKEDRSFVEVLRKKVSAAPEIDFFYDLYLNGRTAWDEELEARFQEADGYVFFLSDDYIDADAKTYIHEKEWPIMHHRWKAVPGGLPVMGIKVSPANAARIPLLKDYTLFKKGDTMPNPDSEKLAASAFMQEFVDDWVFKEFLK